MAAGCSASPRAAADRRRGAARRLCAVDAIDFPDGFCRRDIGWREIAREAGRRVYEPYHVALAQAADRARSHPARRLAGHGPLGRGAPMRPAAAARRLRRRDHRAARTSGPDEPLAAVAHRLRLRPHQRFPARRPARPAGHRRAHAADRRHIRRGLGSAASRRGPTPPCRPGARAAGGGIPLLVEWLGLAAVLADRARHRLAVPPAGRRARAICT